MLCIWNIENSRIKQNILCFKADNWAGSVMRTSPECQRRWASSTMVSALSKLKLRRLIYALL